MQRYTSRVTTSGTPDQSIDMISNEAERQEWQRAIDLLGRSTRSGRLLEYLGARYFDPRQTQLTEIDIAIDVFGRSPKTFDPTVDAVVRVEAHRLRKKLRDIYEKDKRSSGLQISLPAGTYIPQFNPMAETANPTASGQTGATGWRRVPSMVWALGAMALLIGSVVVFRMRYRAAEVPPATSAAPSSSTASTPAPATATENGPLTAVHILAGHSGGEVIDNSGVRWLPDRYYASGGIWSRDEGFVGRTSRPFLFSNWRTGEFGYNFPMAPGVYELRLYFIAPQRVGDEKISTFNVAVNGNDVLRSFDITMSANGTGIAEEQVFRDIRPAEDGHVRLWFSNLAGSPLLNALELTPGIPGQLKPIRITAQPTSFVDHKGQHWRADDYFLNGFRSTERRKISGTEDPELFGAERFGHFSYAIPVDRRGRYTVVLHFAELYYGPRLPGGGGEGSRVFHVFCNGQTLLRDFDIYKEAGSLRVLSKSFKNVQPSAQGKINLVFEPVVNNATVSAIEILEEP
jgi:hypothetical protein